MNINKETGNANLAEVELIVFMTEGFLNVSIKLQIFYITSMHFLKNSLGRLFGLISLIELGKFT